MPFVRLIFALVLVLSRLACDQGARAHIPYLAQKGDVEHAIELYKEHAKEQGGHDFEILNKLGDALLKKGSLSAKAEEQMLALYGAGYAAHSSALLSIETALKSEHLQIQLAAIHLLARFDDDRCHSILSHAMSSPFLYTRMEAAHQLCLRKSHLALGQIEALMHRVPKELRFYFPPFFALIGTKEGTQLLKTLLDDSDLDVRTESILSVARSGVEELLPFIRSIATHPNLQEQEAAAYALGELKDVNSLPKLQKLARSSDPNVSLAALRALYVLGDLQAKDKIIERAREENLFAIHLLGEIEGSQEALVALLKSSRQNIRFGATWALLKLRDPRAAEPLKEWLLPSTIDIGFAPASSSARSLVAWRVIPSAHEQQNRVPFDIIGASRALREQMLRDALELPLDAFLSVASSVLSAHQFELIPFLVRLIENLESPKGSELLRRCAQKGSVPLVRAYCTLALFRMGDGNSYASAVKAYLEQGQGKELIRFRTIEPKQMRPLVSAYELTPEEHSRLFIETLETLAERSDDKGLDLILDQILRGNPKNRPLLAGILLKALQ